MKSNSLPEMDRKEIPLLEAQNWTIDYSTAKGVVRAVDSVSFKLFQGKSLGLVGESGSGKSTLAKVLVKWIPLTSGRYRIRGNDVTNCSADSFFPYRKTLQLIFQNPYLSLNPKLSIRQILHEPFRIHFNEMPSSMVQSAIAELLEKVELLPDVLSQKPDELSGGQAQRVAIARALAVKPHCLICDEATSSLDVTVQASVLKLLKTLQKSEQLTLFFISHNLPIVESICDSVMVMKNGQCVEHQETAKLFQSPQDSYTRMLLESSYADAP